VFCGEEMGTLCCPPECCATCLHRLSCCLSPAPSVAPPCHTVHCGCYLLHRCMLCCSMLLPIMPRLYWCWGSLVWFGLGHIFPNWKPNCSVFGKIFQTQTQTDTNCLNWFGLVYTRFETASCSISSPNRLEL